MSKADPKHGRWILPLVVVGIVAFTFVFVRALEPAESPAAAGTTTTVATTTTSPSATTTTLTPETAAFVAAAEAIQLAAAELAEEAVTANEEWEDGGSYTAALNALRDIEARTEDLALEVQNTPAPAAAQEPWAEVQAAADAMLIAANGMVEGIQAADNGQIRRDALEDYVTAEEELDAAVTVSIAAAKS